MFLFQKYDIPNCYLWDMIDINELHEITSSIASKSGSAFPSPIEWNNYANYAQIDLFNSYVAEWRSLLHKNQQAVTLNMPMALKVFVVNEANINFTGGVGNIPADQSSNLQLSANGKTVKKIDYKVRESYLNSLIDFPTVDYPIYCELGGTLLIYPNTIPNGKLTYLKTPATVKWAYTLSGGTPVYDATNSVQFGWQEVEKEKLMSRILLYMGIAVKDTELVQESLQLKATT